MAQFAGNQLTCIRGERTVFSGLDFALQDGDVLVLVGPNGSGKTSLLRMMAGLLPPVSGELTWNDRTFRDEIDDQNFHVHYVGHLSAVKPMLTVHENLDFWAGLNIKENQGEDRADFQFGVEAALNTFAIDHLADVPARYLSAGQKRRVALARLLTTPAPLWLLDEPATALDSAAMKILDGLIASHRASGGMVVLATHATTRPPQSVTLDVQIYCGSA